MIVKKNDILYVIMSFLFVSIAIVGLGNPDTRIALFGAVGLMGIIMLMAIMIKPNIGADILIIAIFTNISSILTVRGYPGIIKPLVILVFLAIIARNYYAGQLPKERKKTFTIEMFLILYLVAMTVSYLAASNKDRAMSEILDQAKDTFIIYTILFAIRGFGTWKQAMWVVIITTAFLCLLGLYQAATGNYTQDFFGLASVKTQGVFTDDNSSTPRLSGPIGDPNMWGQVVVAIIPFVIFQIFQQRGRVIKLVGVGILGLLGIELLNTYSRGGYLTLAVILVLFFFVFEKRFNPLIAFSGIGLIILLIPLLPANYINRFQTLIPLTPSSQGGGVSIYADDSFRGRASEMITGLAIFTDHPLFGVGAGNFPNNYQKYAQRVGIELRSEERDPHSLITQIMAETGIMGMISFAGLVISLFAGLSRSARTIRRLPKYYSVLPWINAFQLSILAYLTAAIFLHGAYIRYFWILVALGMTVIQLVDEARGATGVGSLSRETSP